MSGHNEDTYRYAFGDGFGGGVNPSARPFKNQHTLLLAARLLIANKTKEKPYYFVMRNPANSKDGDSLITNFEQIFTYIPDTVRKIL